MASKSFIVEATVTLNITSAVDPKSRQAVQEWLQQEFYDHEKNFIVDPNENKVVARVTSSVDINLSEVEGDSLEEQLDDLHKIACRVLGESLKITAEDIWQLDLLVTN